MHLLSLEELHKIEAGMLHSFIEFCREHDLRYYACGGTLLGAVRHQGFIPWDDDIDILMPRPDYERLQTIITIDGNLDKYEFRSNRLKNLHEAYTKLVDPETFLDRKKSADEFDNHVWIDIFPMDGLPDDYRQTAGIYRKVLFLRKLLVLEKAKLDSNPPSIKNGIRKLLKPFVCFFVNPEWLAAKTERIAARIDFDEAEYIGGIVCGYGPREKIRKADFLPSVLLSFEGLMISATSNYDAYLKNLYGDYRQLPPEEKRKGHSIDYYRCA